MRRFSAQKRECALDFLLFVKLATKRAINEPIFVIVGDAKRIKATEGEEFVGPSGDIGCGNSSPIEFVFNALAPTSLGNARTNKHGAIAHIVDEAAIEGALHGRFRHFARKPIARKPIDELARTTLSRTGKTSDFFESLRFVFGALGHDWLKAQRCILQTRASARLRLKLTLVEQTEACSARLTSRACLLPCAINVTQRRVMEAGLRFFRLLLCAAGGAERPTIGMGLGFLQKLFCILLIDIRHIGPNRCA